MPLPGALKAILDGLPVGVFVLAADGTPVYSNPAADELLGAAADPSIGAGQLASAYHAVVAGTGEPYPAERMPIVRALAGETSTVDDIEIERPGGTVPVEVWAAPVRGADEAIAYAVAAFYDISERRQAEADAARLHADNARQSRWLAAVREVQFAVLAGAGLDDALELVASRARDVLDCDSASIGIPGTDGSLVIRAAAGLGEHSLRGTRLVASDSIMGEVIGMEAPAVLDDASSHGSLADPVVRLDVGAAVFVPLVADGGAFGALCVARRRGGPLFSEHDVLAAEAFANQAAMAVQVGRAQRDLAHLAVARDRERRMEDLYDDLVASLSSLRERLDNGATQRAVAELDRIILDIGGHRGTTASARTSGDELEAALTVLAVDFEARTGVITVVDVDDRAAGRLGRPATDVVDLFRSALASLDRHRGARTCRLTVARGPAGVVVGLDDDAPEGTAEAQLDRTERLVGLAGRMGAQVDVQRAPGGGTRARFLLKPAP